MSTTIYLHGPHNFTASLTGGGKPDAFASLSTGDASLFLRTRAECDALIKAAAAAKDLLTAAQCQACIGRECHCDHPAEPGPCGDIAEHTGRTCELPPGHDGWHRAGQITWSRADCAPPATPAEAEADAAEALPAYTEPPGVEYGPLRAGTL